MSTIRLHQTTTSTPEQFVAGLTDFGPGRSKLFGSSADEYLKVHHQGSKEADVTEGSGGPWERLHGCHRCSPGAHSQDLLHGVRDQKSTCAPTLNSLPPSSNVGRSQTAPYVFRMPCGGRELKTL